jgi:F0F1-type ATP synthase membrane subunit c/vacuolar-type H+-ATPase subunit K
MPQLFQARIIWAALVASQFLFIGLLFAGVLRPPPEPPDPQMLYLLAGLSIVVAVVSFALPMYLGGQIAQQVIAQLRHEGEPSNKRIIERAFQAGFSPFIISIALSESISIYGLVLGALGFSRMVALPFFAAGIALTLVRFPTQGTFLRRFEEAFSRTLRT